nr:hypothetical protein [Tanacetum cinerariifolium]
MQLVLKVVLICSTKRTMFHGHLVFFGDVERDVNVKETFHDQTDDELSKKELKQIEADDQAIQTILLGLPEDIYAAVNSCETAQEIWLRIQQMMKGSDIGIQEKKAKLFNQWERFTSNEGESIESYYHCFLKLMNDLKRNKHFPEKIASNLKFLNNLQREWSRHVTIVHQTKDLHTADYTQLYDFLKYNQKEVDELKAERLAKIQDPLALMANSNNPYASPAPHQDLSPCNQNFLQQPMPNPEDITDSTTAMNMALALMAKAFKLNYSTLTKNNQRISLNPRNRQIAQPGMNMGQDRQMQMVGGNGYQSSPALQDNLILSVIEQLKTQVVNCTKINQDNKNVNEILTAKLERYQNQVRILKEQNNVDKASASCAQSLEIENLKHTLSEYLKENESLEQKSRSKMLKKQKDPMMSEKKVNTKPVDYAALNQLLKDFETCFVPQTKLSAEQAFWSQNSRNSEESIFSSSTTIVEVPKELPKVSMVNSSLKKLKFHLANFDMVVKERTTATTITEGT